MNVIALPDGTVTLDELVARVEAGEEIVIARDGKLVARLVPALPAPAAVPADTFVHPTPRKPRQFGLYAGLASIGPEFYEPLPEEELRLWEGGGDE